MTSTSFRQPERIDLHRSQPGKHLALGIGRHHCIGAQLARQEIISALSALLERYDGVRVHAGSAAARIYTPSFFGRNLRETARDAVAALSAGAPVSSRYLRRCGNANAITSSPAGVSNHR